MRFPCRLLSFGPILALCVCSPAPAAPLERTLYLVNAGTQPVYAVRVEPARSGTWSDDLLGPTEVIDVGEAQHVRVYLEDSCWYDMRLHYADGHDTELHDLDLCSTRQLFLKD